MRITGPYTLINIFDGNECYILNYNSREDAASELAVFLEQHNLSQDAGNTLEEMMFSGDGLCVDDEWIYARHEPINVVFDAEEVYF